METNKEERKCIICDRKLADLNNTGQCYFHTMKTDTSGTGNSWESQVEGRAKSRGKSKELYSYW